MKTVNILQLCEWSIKMNESWGDGWNGASVTIAFTEDVELAPINKTLSDGASSTKTFETSKGYDMMVILTRRLPLRQLILVEPPYFQMKKILQYD